MPDRPVLRSTGLRYCCQRLLWLLVRNSVPVAAGAIKTAHLREQRPMFAGNHEHRPLAFYGSVM